MTVLTNCFVPRAQQLRAMRVLLGLDELAACELSGLTPLELKLVEFMDDILPDDQAEQRASVIFQYAGALVAAGGILRLTLDGDNHLYDAVIPKRPDDEYTFDPGSITPTQLRAARYAFGMSQEEFSQVFRAYGADSLSVLEVLTKSNVEDFYPQWWGTGHFLSPTEALRKAGVFVIDPSTTGHSEFGLRFKVAVNG